jgi:succinoglycan biosynthesis protein ExoA
VGDPQLPHASVAIPVLNEQRAIEACLDAVLAQDYPAGLLEVLVVDGGSRDRTVEIVERLAASSTVPIRLLDNPAGSTPAGLNRALSVAQGEFFVRVDGHSAPAPSYVRACVAGAIELRADLAGGWVEAVGGAPFARAVAAAFGSPFAMGNAVSWQPPSAPRQVASVPCGAYRTDALRRIGGFDEEQRANQDYEVNYRIRRAGGTVWLLPGVSFAYVPRDSVRALARQFARYGFYKARTMVKHPSSIRPRHLVPAAGLGVALVLAALAPFSGAAAAVLGAAVALYLLALGAATVLAARRLDARAAARLPLVFATMHCAWAVGSVAGLVRWLSRRHTIRASAQLLST